jgi:hypothetical protein
MYIFLRPRAFLSQFIIKESEYSTNKHNSKIFLSSNSNSISLPIVAKLLKRTSSRSRIQSLRPQDRQFCNKLHGDVTVKEAANTSHITREQCVKRCTLVLVVV